MPGYKIGRFIRGKLTEYQHKKTLSHLRSEHPLATYSLTDAISVFSDKVVVSTFTTTDSIPIRNIVKITVQPGLGEDVITLTHADETWSRSRQVWASVEPGKAEAAGEMIRNLGYEQGMNIRIEQRKRTSPWGLMFGIGLAFAIGWIAVFVAPWGIYLLPLIPISLLAVIQFVAMRRRSWRPLTPLP